jgi:hypothetical protein
MKKTLVALCVMASTGLATGCVVHTYGYVEDDGPVVEYGYEPVLYDGYVVYYADGGLPFIWLNGLQFWIPVVDRPFYMNHYHQHHDAYHAWYQHRGAMYREHRYSDRSRGRYHGNRERPALHRADDRDRDNRPVLHRADDRDRDRDNRPVLRRADDRDRDRDNRPTLQRADDRPRQPAVRKAPENRPQPKAKPQPEPKAKPKLKKKGD